MKHKTFFDLKTEKILKLFWKEFATVRSSYTFALPFEKTLREKRSKKRKVSQLQIDSYDYCTYNLEYNVFDVSIILNYYRIEPKREIEIIFDDNIYTCDLLSSKITNSKNELIFIDKDFHINDTYLNQADYFIKNINTIHPYMNNTEESFNILKIALYE